MQTLRILARAQIEITEIVDWYEAQRAGLGSQLQRRLRECTQRIRSFPAMYPTLKRRYRWARIKQFPFGLIYAKHRTEIVVYAMIHNSRDRDVILREMP